MPEEIELKYSIDDPKAVEAWVDETFPLTDGQRWRTVTITDRYFDTADGALAGAGYGARLRRAGGRTVLTLKSDIEVDGGLHRRLELEGPARRALDAVSWPASEARDRLVSVADGRRLVERFVVRQRRRERDVVVGGAQLVAAVDDGVVLAAGSFAGEIRQFELELYSGRRTGLDRAARAVAAGGLGEPESRSKLVVALAMAEAASHVRGADQFASAGRKILRRHLVRMLDREMGTRSGDELALKQMRVATRRLRATWRVYKDGFRRPTQRRFVNETRRVGRTLGAVRDLDVLLEALPGDPELDAFRTQLSQRRTEAFAGAIRVIDGRRYARFVDDLLALTEDPQGGTARKAAGETVASLAPAALAGGVQRVRNAAAAAIGTDDAAAWHALRIEGRRLRYSIEAFSDALDERSARDLIKRITRVQDHLGAMNDAAVGIAEASLWLAATGSEAGAPAHVALSKYIARREAEIVQLRGDFGKAWRGLSGLSFDRLLTRAVAALTGS